MSKRQRTFRTEIKSPCPIPDGSRAHSNLTHCSFGCVFTPRLKFLRDPLYNRNELDMGEKHTKNTFGRCFLVCLRPDKVAIILHTHNGLSDGLQETHATHERLVPCVSAHAGPLRSKLNKNGVLQSCFNVSLIYIHVSKTAFASKGECSGGGNTQPAVFELFIF